jgi:multiple sugar transport system substrate-binding protein
VSQGPRRPSRSVRERAGRQRAAVAAAVILAGPTLLYGCGEDEGATPTLTWYINPDNGGQADLAAKCGQQSEGAYRIETQILPNEADQQREQLVRRLAADDPSIDLMSLDPPFVAEFANAGYILPITDPADVETFTEGVLEAPLETAFWDDQLVAPPFWANTQLLWYRKSVAEAAGVDPTAADFTWDQMIEAAESQGKRIGVQGRRYEGYMVWVNALITSGGGQIIENADLGADATPTVASEAGDKAAEIIGSLARSSAAPSDMSTAGEEEARSLFQGADGSFMVNWPYVYNAAKEAVAQGAIDQSVVDDIAWARYPAASAGQPSTPPLGGINLGIGAFTKYPDEALAAAKCITSLESGVEYMIGAGNPAARAAAYDDPGVREAYPMADLIRDSINSAGPRPVTPYYGDVSVSVQRTWHPPESVQQPSTPQDTDDYMSEVLSGDRLL